MTGSGAGVVVRVSVGDRVTGRAGNGVKDRGRYRGQVQATCAELGDRGGVEDREGAG